MNKKQVYNKGVESGLKVAQKIMEQEVEAMEYLKSKMDLIVDGHDEMKMAVDRLIVDADATAIRDLFKVCNTATPSDLKEHEKQLLLCILATLSKNGVNEAQREYHNNLRHHMDLKGYQPDSDYNFKFISEIESVKSIKIIAKAVRIFLYLCEENWDAVYQYEDELFSHFEIRGFDEIDAQIELLMHLFGNRGLIELYGDFDESGEYEQRDLSFLSPEEREYKDINRECANIYFKECYMFDINKQYIESSSFIIYSDENKIMKLSKISGAVSLLFDDIENPGKFIKERHITTYYDMAYYVKDNKLFYVNLQDDGTGLIFEIPEEKNDEGVVYDVKALKVYKGEKVIFRNGYKKYLVDLEIGIDSMISFSTGSESDNFFIRGDYVYFLDMEPNLDDIEHTQYVVKKYGILNNQTTIVSKPLGKHKTFDGIYEIYNLYSEGMYGSRYYCIFSYGSVTSRDRIGFQCFWVDVDRDCTSEVHNFYIWQPRVYQIEQYKNKLVYVNADKGYALTTLDFVTDKKEVLVKKFGETEKSTLSERLLMGKEVFQNPYEYMRLGKWIWYVKKDKSNPEIISI